MDVPQRNQHEGNHERGGSSNTDRRSRRPGAHIPDPGSTQTGDGDGCSGAVGVPGITGQGSDESRQEVDDEPSPGAKTPFHDGTQNGQRREIEGDLVEAFRVNEERRDYSPPLSSRETFRIPPQRGEYRRKRELQAGGDGRDECRRKRCGE